MGRKRLAAALLLCVLVPAAALADWADEQSDALCARMTALAAEEVYVRLFTDNDQVLSQVERMAANAGAEVKRRRRFVLRDEASYADYVEWEGLELPALSETAAGELEKRLAAMPSSLLNGQAGAEWLAAASLLTVSETFLMPEGFVPCIVLLDYGTEADAMVVFTQTGRETVTAQAAFVNVETVEAAMDEVLLLYTEVEAED